MTSKTTYIAVIGIIGAGWVALRCLVVIGLGDQSATAGQVSIVRAPLVARVPAAATAPVAPGPRRPHAPPVAGEVRSLTIKELGNFDYLGAGGVIPQDIRRLDGSTVRLGGFMVPANQIGDASADQRVTRFALVPNVASCCYGQPPGVQHVVTVECPPDHAIPFTSHYVSVEGTLRVGETRDEGFVISLFALKASDVREAPAPQ
jgi:hypothetical protein